MKVNELVGSLQIYKMTFLDSKKPKVSVLKASKSEEK